MSLRPYTRPPSPLAEPSPTPVANRPLQLALLAVLGAVAVLVLSVAFAVLLVAFQLTHAGGSAASALGAAAHQTAQALGNDVQSAAQALHDSRDPLHPPRYAIRQDPRFDQLQMVRAGQQFGTAAGYRYVLVDIEQRLDATTADQRLNGRIRRSLIVPKVVKIFGITIRTDDDRRDYALYRGQEFALGGRAFKVDDVSAEGQSLILLRYSNEQDAGGPFVFSQP